MAKQHRREHPVPGIAPRMSIEAHASAANARRKNLQAFAPVHPSMAGQGNRGHAVTKAQAPAAPVQAHSLTGRPTKAIDVHSGAAGRGISGRDTPGHGGVVSHDPGLGDRILNEVYDAGAVNNAVSGERHHSVTTDRLPSKPADSTTTPQSLIQQFKRWNDGEC